MTRVNCIPPSQLSRAHLVAEYRELPRIFALARAAMARGETPDDRRNPRDYTFGAGHVRFFYTRLGFLAKRQSMLIGEMIARGYNPAFRETAHLLDGMPPEWCCDWQPDERAVAINRARIAERGSASPGPVSDGTPTTPR